MMLSKIHNLHLSSDSSMWICSNETDPLSLLSIDCEASPNSTVSIVIIFDTKMFYTFFWRISQTLICFVCGDFDFFLVGPQNYIRFFSIYFIPFVCLLFSLLEISSLNFHHIRLEWKTLENWEDYKRWMWRRNTHRFDCDSLNESRERRLKRKKTRAKAQLWDSVFNKFLFGAVEATCDSKWSEGWDDKRGDRKLKTNNREINLKHN